MTSAHGRLDEPKAVSNGKAYADPTAIEHAMRELFARPAPESSRIPHQALQAQLLDDVAGQVLLEAEEGFILGARGHRFLRLQPDGHLLTIAKPGAGKGTDVIIVNLLDHEGSVVSVEIGGATYRHTHNFRRHVLQQRVVLFDPFGVTGDAIDGLNLLATYDPDSPTFKQDIEQLAYSLMRDPDGQREKPYFEHQPADTLTSLLIDTRTDPDLADSDRHLVKVLERLSTYGTDSWTSLMRRFATDTGRYAMTLNRTGRYFGSARDENRNSIISSITKSLKFADDPSLRSTLRQSSFDLTDLGRGHLTVYIVMPDVEKFRALAGWLRSLLERSFQLVPNLGDGGSSYQHRDRILYVLDEFTQLSRLDCVANGMLTLRQKGITLWSLIQDIAKLKEVYGDNIASSFLGAASCVQVFGTSEQATLEYVSGRCGKGVVFIPNITHGVNAGHSSSANWQETLSLTTTEGVQKTFGHSVTGSWSHSRSKQEAVAFNTAFTAGRSDQFGSSRTRVHEGHEPWILPSWRKRQSTQVGSSDSSGTNESRTQGTQASRSLSDSINIGMSCSTQESDSVSFSESQGQARAKGGASGASGGASYTVSYTGHIVAAFEPATAERQLMHDDQQLLLISGRHQGAVLHLNLLERRTRFFQHPTLRARAAGPVVLGAPMLLSPLEKPVPGTLPPATTPIATLCQHHHETLEASVPPEPADAEPALAAWLHNGGGRHRLASFSIAAQGAQWACDNWLEERRRRSEAFAHRVSEYGEYLRERTARLAERRRLVQARQQACLDEQTLLIQYRDVLLADLRHESTYLEVQEQYKGYVEALCALRERWTSIDVPERPTASSLRSQADVLDNAALGARLKAVERTPAIPGALPGIAPAATEAVKSPPRRTAASELSVEWSPPNIEHISISGVDSREIQDKASPWKELARAAGVVAIVLAVGASLARQDERIARLPSKITHVEEAGAWTRFWCTSKGEVTCPDKRASIEAYHHNQRIISAQSSAAFAKFLIWAGGLIGLVVLALGVPYTVRSFKLADRYRSQMRDALERSHEERRRRSALLDMRHRGCQEQADRLHALAQRLVRLDGELSKHERAIEASWSALPEYRTALDQLNDLLQTRREVHQRALCEWKGWDRLTAQGSAANGTKRGAKPATAPRRATAFDSMTDFDHAADAPITFGPRGPNQWRAGWTA